MRPISVELSTIGRGTLINISQSGALVNIPVRQKVGREVTFALRTHGLDLRASIVRCEPHRDAAGERLAWTGVTSYDIAVRFGEMPTASATTLRKVIAVLSGVNGRHK